jgi:hypothetical protein
MKAIAILLVAGIAACQATTTSSGSPQVRTTSAEVATFAPFRTFGFRLATEPPAPYQVSSRSFDVERRVRDLVTAELERKGYTEGPNADFLVRISSGTAQADETQPTTTSGGNENQPQAVTAGAVIVDAFDGSTSQQVWHGTAQAVIDPQRVDEARLETAVRQMLAPFPARSAPPATR